MLKLEDKITLALAGPIKSGKDVLMRYAPQYQDLLFQCLQGNFWVPQKLTTINPEQNAANATLFEKYSKNPPKYAFEFQCQSMAHRLAQQNQVEQTNGLVLLGQPLEIDRHIYGEANKNSINDAFPTYEQLYTEVKKRVTSPDIWIYLRIPEKRIDVLLERIRQNGREGEKKFLGNSAYLLQNIRLHEQFFQKVRQPVIVIDATHPNFGLSSKEKNCYGEHFQQLYASLAQEIRQHKTPPRLTLDEWEALDHNQALNGEREARRQLHNYLQQAQTIITIAGLVGCGKTGLAELIGGELEINILRELENKRNDLVGNELLSNFLRDMKTYAYDLQAHLLKKRTNDRKKEYALGKSFVEDRSPTEDQCIFWPILSEAGHLDSAKISTLNTIAQKTYAESPKSNLMIKLNHSPRECRKKILLRGRAEEVQAWPESMLQKMQPYYDTLFTEMERYGSHAGPKLELNLAEFSPDSTIHQGYLWQEMLQGLLGYRKLK